MSGIDAQLRYNNLVGTEPAFLLGRPSAFLTWIAEQAALDRSNGPGIQLAPWYSIPRNMAYRRSRNLGAPLSSVVV